MVRRLIALSAALCWGGTGLAAETDDVARWEQTQRVFLPGEAAAGTRQVAKGDVVFEAPLRWAKSLRLQNDVAVTHAGNSVTLPAGTQLPLVRFITKSEPTTLRFAYCTRFGIINTESTFIRDTWLFKAPFNAKGKQLCLEDTDKDGTLDRSFVKSIQHIMGRPDIIYTGPVSVSGQDALTLEPIDGAGDMVRFVMIGIGKNKVQMRIEITIRNGWMNFSRLQTSGYDLLPVHNFRQGSEQADLLGMDMRLLGFDSAAKSAEFAFGSIGRSTPIIIPDDVMAF